MISIIIPSYNDKSRLLAALAACRDYLSGLGIGYELIPVCDGSSDGTAEALRAQADEHFRPVVYFPNRGKGYAVRQGCLAARGDYVVFMDSDLAVPLEYLKPMLELLKRCDVVIGSRSCPGAKVVKPQPVTRRVTGRAFNLAARCLAGVPYSDTQCGFKGFRREAARAVFSRAAADGFSFDVEILVLARKLNLSVAEMGVEWRDGGESGVSLAKGMRAFWELGGIIRRAGRYETGGKLLVGESAARHVAPAAGEISSPARPGL